MNASADRSQHVFSRAFAFARAHGYTRRESAGKATMVRARVRAGEAESFALRNVFQSDKGVAL